MRLHRILLLIIIAAVPLFVRADIAESGEALVKRRQHNQLKLLNEKFGTPIAPFPVGQALVSLEMSGTSLSVLIVGPIEGNAKAYATALDAWREKEKLPGTVVYSQEDDCAAAAWELTQPKLWAKSAKLEAPLRSLAVALSQVEKEVRFTLAVRKASAMQGFPPPGSTSSAGTQLWKFEDASEVPTVATATTTAGPNDATLAIIWLLFMPVVTWIIAPLVWFVTMRFGSDVVARRKIYSKAIMGGIMGAIGLHAVATFFVLTGRTFDPISQIWFASRFTSIAMPVVLVGLPIGLIPLLILQKKERKLFGLGEGEPVVERKSVLPADDPLSEKKASKTIKWVALGTFAGLGIFYAITQTLPTSSKLRSLSPFFFFLIGSIVVRLVTSWVEDRRHQAVAASPEYGELIARFLPRGSAMNRVMGTNARVKLDTRSIASFSASAPTGNEVKVGVDLVATLSDEELDFVIAHELAHIKLKHPQKQLLIFLAPFLALILSVFLLVSLKAPRAVILIMLPFLILEIVSMRWLVRRQELVCDEMAVRATGNKEAAKSALLKITYGSSNPGVHTIDTTHPAVQKRLAAIDALPWPLS